MVNSNVSVCYRVVHLYLLTLETLIETYMNNRNIRDTNKTRDTRSIKIKKTIIET